MAKKIKWTIEAEAEFDKVILYLEQNWTDKEILKFISATNRVLNFISEFPLMFRKSKKKNIHEALVSEHNLLIYKVKKEHIEILTFWDTRQNPRRKKKII
jgi:plasmid stabilization system protein ParE